jgi:hypothetical protein
MLVKYDDRLAVVIESHERGGEKSFTAIVPYLNKDHLFVEVEMLDETNIKVIAPALDGWRNLGRGWEGYPAVTDLKSQIYNIWDDGASDHPQAAEELQNAFMNIIETFREPALKYLEEYYQEEYDRQVSDARTNGWDWRMIEKRQAEFPYKI